MRFPLFGKKETPVTSTDKSSDLSVTLTPIGKQKAEAFALEGPRFDVIATILEEGTASMREISTKTGMPVNKVKEVCKALARSGYIKFIKVQ